MTTPPVQMSLFRNSPTEPILGLTCQHDDIFLDILSIFPFWLSVIAESYFLHCNGKDHTTRFSEAQFISHFPWLLISHHRQILSADLTGRINQYHSWSASNQNIEQSQ